MEISMIYRRIVAVAAVLVLTSAAAAGAGKGAAAKERNDEMRHVQLIILGTSKDYKKLETQAKGISKKAGVPFDMAGMIYDAKKGLVCKDDPVWAGEYLCRRDPLREVNGKVSYSPYISIE